MAIQPLDGTRPVLIVKSEDLRKVVTVFDWHTWTAHAAIGRLSLATGSTVSSQTDRLEKRCPLSSTPVPPLEILDGPIGDGVLGPPCGLAQVEGKPGAISTVVAPLHEH